MNEPTKHVTTWADVVVAFQIMNDTDEREQPEAFHLAHINYKATLKDYEATK